METIVHEIRIASPIDRVRADLTTAEGLKSWFTADVSEGPSAGELTFAFSDHEPFRWRVSSTEPDGSVRWECLDGPGSAPGSTATFRLSTRPDGRTQVNLEHEGLDGGHESFASCNTRWGILLGHLKDSVEQGQRAPAFA